MSYMLSSLFVFLFSGMPVAVAIGGACVVYLFFGGDRVPAIALAQRITSGADSFIMLAIPFFMLAGELMNAGGITKRLVRLARGLVGHFSGGLAYVVVLVNMIMAGVSGAAIADAAAVGSVMIPSMERDGYRKEFAAAINAAAATIGPVIPPSVGFVIYGSLANVSVGKLFLAGAVPGVIMGIYLMAACFVVARREKLPRGENVPFREKLHALKDSAAAIIMPVIILGGILTGVVTPTEAAVIAVVYGLFVGLFVYREIKPAQLPRMLANAGKSTAVIMFIIAVAQAFGWFLTRMGVPGKLVGMFGGLTHGAVIFLVVINVVLLILGCFMEGGSIMILLTPLLMPVIAGFGIDPVQFGVVMQLNIMIGLLTPPVGMLLYVVAGISKLPIQKMMRDMMPFYAALLAVLIMVTYIPELSLWLPSVM
jgi:C4-dicarboxylate transporter DctM subunit